MSMYFAKLSRSKRLLLVTVFVTNKTYYDGFHKVEYIKYILIALGSRIGLINRQLLSSNYRGSYCQ